MGAFPSESDVFSGIVCCRQPLDITEASRCRYCRTSRRLAYADERGQETQALFACSQPNMLRRRRATPSPYFLEARTDLCRTNRPSSLLLPLIASARKGRSTKIVWASDVFLSNARGILPRECLSWLDERYHNNHRILPSSRPPQHVARVPSLAIIVLLLWLASWMTSWVATFAVAITFSYVMLTNYALLHDATHDTLRSGVRANYWLGFLRHLVSRAL